jgi:hypothetical protein
MTIVMVAHCAIERFDDPRAPTYTSYLPKLQKRARHLILDACDVVGFLAEELHVAISVSGFGERTRAVSNNQRFLFVEGCPAFVAKNRYGMPPKIPIPADFNIGDLAKYWLTIGENDERAHDHDTALAPHRFCIRPTGMIDVTCQVPSRRLSSPTIRVARET